MAAPAGRARPRAAASAASTARKISSSVALVRQRVAQRPARRCSRASRPSRSRCARGDGAMKKKSRVSGHVVDPRLGRSQRVPQEEQRHRAGVAAQRDARARDAAARSPPPIGAQRHAVLRAQPLREHAADGRRRARAGRSRPARGRPGTSAAGTSRQMPPARSSGPSRSRVARTGASRRQEARLRREPARRRPLRHLRAVEQEPTAVARCGAGPRRGPSPRRPSPRRRTTRRSGRGSDTWCTLRSVAAGARWRASATVHHGRAAVHRRPPAATNAASAARPPST